MVNENKIHALLLHRAKLIIAAISVIAIVAVAIAIYAFDKKHEADADADIARQKIREGMQQQKIALEQRTIADSNKEQAVRQRELALQSERTALEQRQIATTQTTIAEESKQEALQQQNYAQKQMVIAEEKTTLAEANAQEAQRQQLLAEKEKNFSKEEKERSDRLKDLAESRKIANESVLLTNENYLDSGRRKALQAYQLNKINHGPSQNLEIFYALQTSWIKDIRNSNQCTIHGQPVHCVAGMPGSNIIFSADENGMLYECVVKSNSIQKINSYNIGEAVRALAVSPDGSKLVAATSAGSGTVFTVSGTNISVQSNFKFAGSAKSVVFNGSQQFILLSTKMIGKYSAGNPSNPLVINHTGGITACIVGKSSRLYTAFGNTLKIYDTWDDLNSDVAFATLQADSKIYSIATDEAEEFIAAGTYNGFVWIGNTKSNAFQWNRGLHLSAVNDLEFCTVDNGTIQLASAGADQTIKLIDVNAALQKNNAEDIITLKGHSRWVYSLCYTTDGQWLLSSGEDNRIIAWKPTMACLYQTLYNK